MVHDILGEIVDGVAEAAMDVASDEVQRRWGWKGCLTVVLVVVLLVVALLWALGVFSNA